MNSDELAQGRKDLAAMLETPLSDYVKLHELLSSICPTNPIDAGHKSHALHLLHKIRPRGIRLTVAMCVKNHKGQVLCVNRKSDPSRVCFPGGYVDPGDLDGHINVGHHSNVGNGIDEALLRAAIRELKEETGLASSDDTYPVFRAPDECGTLCTMFRTWPAGDQAIVPEPGTQCLWLVRDEFMARCAWPDYYGRAIAAGAF